MSQMHGHDNKRKGIKRRRSHRRAIDGISQSVERALSRFVDTGTMTAIVPVELLAKEQDKYVDVYTVIMVPKAKLMPVNDASHRRMEFLTVVENLHPTV
ncbi:unnamed protein product [Haemonchus placei]|uniref:Reverse transcriptase domain-containing protein n=1 Tax=Haemonchus placei TaxID=6290 RepID=A0A0N4W998_HAEPC|nr:unnamed protein product [Haemonchus placei]